MSNQYGNDHNQLYIMLYYLNTKFEQNQQNCINIVSKVFEEGKCKVRKLPINCQIKMIFIYNYRLCL